MYETTLEFRGISRSLLIEYLLNITQLTSSSIITNENGSVTIQSIDWVVEISKEETFSIVSTIVIPRVFITFHGDKSKIQDIIQKLQIRTLRIGG
ncbi:hypothetical protein [Tepidibacillus fermentans]|uniref:Molybdopterin cofactor biosynthesis MoaD-related C-terminal domain-containing protein n=1 Tax=Tepidibacillus fermentans TaxID=1281767 RepID=A0A4R3KL43_9BACI|nr:hypothetical protein [Tepidibacillus fermentans]TCS84534.1 hypothetical protein EDD72_101203 [Tepidibacillus fermentans]